MLLVICTLLGCSTTTVNDTAYPFQIREDIVSESDIRRIIVAPFNLGVPSKEYIDQYAGKIDSAVIAYLKEHGAR